MRATARSSPGKSGRSVVSAANRVTADPKIGIRRIDGIRQRMHVTVVAQVVSRAMQTSGRARSRPGASSRRGRMPRYRRSRAAQQREQHGFALILLMVRGRNDVAPRRVASAASASYRASRRRSRRVRRCSDTTRTRNSEGRTDAKHDALVLPRRFARPVIARTQARVNPSVLQRRERRRKRNGIRPAAARNDDAIAATEIPVASIDCSSRAPVQLLATGACERAISRSTSRLAMSSRLSHVFLPRARPSCTFTMPRVKYMRSGTIVRPFSFTRALKVRDLLLVEQQICVDDSDRRSKNCLVCTAARACRAATPHRRENVRTLRSGSRHPDESTSLQFRSMRARPQAIREYDTHGAHADYRPSARSCLRSFLCLNASLLRLSHCSDSTVVDGVERTHRDEFALAVEEYGARCVADRASMPSTLRRCQATRPVTSSSWPSGTGFRKTHVQLAVTPRCPAKPAACAIASSSSDIAMPPCAISRQP